MGKKEQTVKNQSRKDNWKDYVFVGLLCLFGLGVVLIFFKLYFISNDDFTLRSIMSGAYTGTPDAHLIYVMYPLGLFFKGLYLILPQVPHYELFTLLTYFVCLYFETYLVLFLFRNKLPKNVFKNKKLQLYIPYLGTATAFFYFYFLTLKFIVESQYTVLAGILMSVAVFYAILLGDCDEIIYRNFRLIVIVVFTMLSLWLRKEVCMMCLPLLLVALLHSFLKEEKRTSFLNKYLLAIILPAVLIAGSFAANAFAYSSPEWDKYMAFNKARTDVFDYNLLPEYEGNEKLYENLDMTSSDYTALLEYNLNLANKVDTGKLNNLANTAKMQKKEWEQYYSVPKQILKDTLLSVKQNMATVPGVILLVVFLSGVFLTTLLRRGEAGSLAYLLLGAAALYYLIFTACFAHLGRLPERVFIALDFNLIFLIFGGMLSGRVGDIKTANMTIKAGVVLLPILMLLFGIVSFSTVKLNQSACAENAAAIRDIGKYARESEGEILYVSAGITASSSYKFFDKEAVSSDNCFYMVDWAYESPLMYQKMEHLGIEDRKESLKDPNAKILLSNYITTYYLIDILNRSGKPVELKPVDYLDGIIVYKAE